VNHGASLFTHAEVRFIERAGDDGWRVTYHRLDEAARSMPLRRVAARMLVIAAGTLGTNEILLRSRERGLPLSNRLGQRVSTNADAIAFGYNNDQRINAVGTGARRRGRDPAVGPAVAGLVDLRTSRGFAIVEAAIQSAMAPVLPLAMSAGAVLGSDSDRGLRDRLEEFGRTAASLIGGSGKGAVANTQVFLAIGHDSASGRIVLDHDRPRIIWPGAAKEPVYARIEEALKSLVAATGGTYVPNPVSKRLLGGNLFTVHPLGGSTMADSATEGVVDERCRVFDPTSPDGAVHAGLYVMDGSIVPRSLGVHPLLTITALAERAMLLFARDQGLRLGVAPKADAPRRDLVLAAEA
jgi:cholesterol oxidase